MRMIYAGLAVVRVIFDRVAGRGAKLREEELQLQRMDQGPLLRSRHRHRPGQDDLSRRRRRWKTRTARAAISCHKGELGQWNYAFDKIGRALEQNGATFGDIVKMVTYTTDVRYQPDFGKCRRKPSATTPMPAHTLLTISQLARPGMLVEIDATAMVPVK